MKKSEADKLRIEFSKVIMALMFDMIQADAGLLTEEECQASGEKIGERLGQFIESMVDEE